MKEVLYICVNSQLPENLENGVNEMIQGTLRILFPRLPGSDTNSRLIPMPRASEKGAEEPLHLFFQSSKGQQFSPSSFSIPQALYFKI